MDNKYKEIELLLTNNENIIETVKSIEHAKKQLELTVDSFSDIVLLLNADGVIIRGNRAVETWGLGQVSQLKGIPYHKLFHKECPVEKCHFDIYREIARERLIETKVFEYRIYDSYLKRFLLVRFLPVSQLISNQIENEDIFSVAIITDITTNKQSELRLSEAETEIKALFRVLPDQYIRLDNNHTIIDIKTDNYYGPGVFKSDSPGKKLDRLLPPDVMAKLNKALDELHETKSLVSLEYSLNIGNTEEFFEIRLLPFLDDQVIMINQYITEKKRLESIAESVDLMKKLGYIFSSIRHEIGNPLNAIKMTMSVLKKNVGKFSEEKILEYTDRVLSQINRMEYLLRSFKNFNMYEEINFEEIRLGEFLRNFMGLVIDDIRERNISLDLEIIPEDLMIQADPRALNQVLLNLISNAVDALQGKENKSIFIFCYKRNGQTAIEIKDNGIGLTDIYKKNIFKPFFTTKTEGTGLGLVIVKKILTRMNGTIEIQSIENEGTTVIVLLPENQIENL